MIDDMVTPYFNFSTRGYRIFLESIFSNLMATAAVPTHTQNFPKDAIALNAYRCFSSAESNLLNCFVLFVWVRDPRYSCSVYHQRGQRSSSKPDTGLSRQTHRYVVTCIPCNHLGSCILPRDVFLHLDIQIREL
jgi:hypothetical protein